MSKEAVIDVLKSLNSNLIVVVSKSKSKIRNQSVVSSSKIIHIDNTEELTTEDICNLSDTSDGLFAYRGSITGTDNGLCICPGAGGFIETYKDWSGNFAFGGVNRRDGTTTLWVNSTGVIKPIFLFEPEKHDVRFKTSQIESSDIFVAEGMAPIVRHNKRIWVWSGDTHNEDSPEGEVYLFKVPSTATPTQLLELTRHYQFLSVGLNGEGRPHLRVRNPASNTDAYFLSDSTYLLEVILQNVDGVRQVKSLVVVDTRNINFKSYIDIDGEVLEVVKSI